VSSKRNSSNKQQVRSHGLAVVTLVLIGLFASALVYLKTSRDAPPASAGTRVAARTDSEQPVDQNRPKYEFYTELPRRELKIEPPPEPSRQQPVQERQPPAQQTARSEPEPARSEPRREPSSPPQQQATAAGSRYVIQAGAYTLYSQADRARARLAMLGVTARIEEGTSNGLPIYRIRIGPMGNAEADSLRQRLRSNNIESIALKVN
jgi:cell division protein FtsN